jgi:hypothetical protein
MRYTVTPRGVTLLAAVVGLGMSACSDRLPTIEQPVPTSSAQMDVVPVTECATPRAGWIWCDDFEQNRTSSYFEYVNPSGSFARTAGVGVSGSSAMRARFAAGQVDAGNLKLAFGRTPDPYMRPVDAGTKDYRQLYWRVYLKNAPGWTGGGGDKLARATIFAGSNWSQAMIAHLWSGGAGNNYLSLDPASGTDAAGTLKTTGYNDFANLRWLGETPGSTPLFDSAHVGQWYCVEAHVKLNGAGLSNGVFEMWLNDVLDARVTGLNWVGSYSAYGINSLMLENYWNAGSPVAQERYIDNLVVSTQRIGCTAPAGVAAPTGLTATPVSGSPDIQLAWSVGGTYDSQALERKYTSPDGSYTDATWTRVRSALAGTATSERDADLQMGARYTYRVIGITGGVESPPSATAAATVGASAPIPVASVTVAPSSASIARGATRQFTATMKDASGNTLTGRVASWSSSNASIATVTTTGPSTADVQGIAAGSATITAVSEGKSGSAQVTVTASPPPPPPGGDPQPAAGNTIYFDTRAGSTRNLQAAPNLSTALSYFTESSGSPNLEFSTNYDGAGTHAFRVKYRNYLSQDGVCKAAGEQNYYVRKYPLASSEPKEMYYQFKLRLGRHPNDAGTSYGVVNQFQVTNDECNNRDGGNRGRKVFLVGRSDPNDGRGNFGRLDLIWPGPAPSTFRIETGNYNWQTDGPWSPQQHVGEALTITLYFKAASSDAAADGIVRAWVNGTQIINVTNALIGPRSFTGPELPSVFNQPQYDQIEYFWDLVIWSPS